MYKKLVLIVSLLLVLTACGSKVEPFKGTIKEFAPNHKIGDIELSMNNEKEDFIDQNTAKFGIQEYQKNRILYDYNGELVSVEQIILRCKNPEKCLELISESIQNSVHSKSTVNGYDIDVYENRFGSYNLVWTHKDIIMTLSGAKTVKSVGLVLNDITQKVKDVEEWDEKVKNQ